MTKWSYDMMVNSKIYETILDAADKLTGYKRRNFIAKVAKDYCNGSSRKTEQSFGWGRKTVEKSIRELETGIQCLDDYQSRGAKKKTEILPNLSSDIESIVDHTSQADPALKNSLRYTKMTANSVREALIEFKDYSDEILPSVSTIRTILNDLDFTLKRVQKTKPKKKFLK